MDIMLKFVCVLFLLFIRCNTIKMKKHNQTIHTEMAKNSSETIHFIEDDIEAITQFEKLKPKIDEPDVKVKLTQKQNTTDNDLGKDFIKSKIIIPNILSENIGIKSISIPIDLLLKHPKIINLSINKHNTTRNVTRNNESNKLFNSKPKTDFCEDTIKAVDDEVSDFYKKIIFTNEQPNKTLENKLQDSEELVEIKMHSDDTEYYKEPISNNNNSLAKPFKEGYKTNYSTSKNETLKEQTVTPTTIEIIINNDLGNSNTASRPKSTIAIHNRRYQEVIQPMKWYNYIPSSYYYPYYYYPSRNNYCSHKPHLCRRYTNPYKFYNIGPYCKSTALYSDDMKSNIVWKSWNNMDIFINSPTDVNLNYIGISDATEFDEIKPKHENTAFDVIQDRYVNYN